MLNVLYKMLSNSHLYTLANKEFWILILVNLLEVKTILKHHITNLSERSLEGVISDI